MCQFLIDTLPIAIASKSSHCIIRAHSNRHSSEPQIAHRLSFNSFISFPSFASFGVSFATVSPANSSLLHAPVSLANKRGLN